MNPFTHVDLIRIHHADMRAAADHHRLVRAAHRADRPQVPLLRTTIGRRVRRRVRVLRLSGP